MLTFLPYHTIPSFATLLSILPKTLDPLLKFLHPYIESVATPSRRTIVYTATHNQNFFSAMNIYILKTCRLGYHYPAFLSFWATTATEAIAGIIDQSITGRRDVQRKKEEDVLLRVLPFLNEMLSMRQVPDLRIGCYMILTVMASKMDLDDKVSTAMMEAVVSDWTENTTHAGIICLAVLAQQRQVLKLPKRVLKAVMSVQGVEKDLLVLSEQYQVGKLTTGLVLGILDRLDKEQVTSRLTFVRTVIEGRLMNNAYVSLAIGAILSAAEHTDISQFHKEDTQGQLADLILRLEDSEVVGALVQDTIRETKINLEHLEAKLQVVLRPDDDINLQTTQDVSMEDAAEGSQEEKFNSIINHIPTRTAYETSFLSHSESYVFGSLAKTFSVASSSLPNIKIFSDLPVLRRGLIMSEPLFLSFFIRYWCGPYSPSSRVAAIRNFQDSLPTTATPAEVQIIFPYILYALADSNPKIRCAATNLIIMLHRTYRDREAEDKNLDSYTIFGKDTIYGSGNETKAISWLSISDASRFMGDILVPSLEELRQDEKYIARLLADLLNGKNDSKYSRSSPNRLKKATRAAILTSLCSHVIHTPLYTVKLQLLSMLNDVEKIGGISKSKLLMPLLLSLENHDEVTLKELCGKEHIDLSTFMDEVAKIVTPNDRDGVQTLQRIIVVNDPVHAISLRKAASQRMRTVWASVKPDIQLSLATALLDLAVTPPAKQSNQEAQEDAIDILRTVPLSFNILHSFINNLPIISPTLDDPSSSAKRRRTSNGHVETQHEPSHAATQQGLRRITTVLELVEGSEKGNDLLLVKGLFNVLADLQHSKNRLGLESGYLQSLVLGCLHAAVEKVGLRATSSQTQHDTDNLKISANIQIERSTVRADLVIDCFRTTSSPQVQQAALLLMSSLASVVPELIIHSVMPIFTFMGTSLLRQSDEYSAHVVDQVCQMLLYEALWWSY